MTTWRIIDSGPCDAAYNMALDEAIATAVRKGDSPPTLRFYGWKTPSVSIGSFQKIREVALQYCTAHGIPVVRRLTGGRGILHGKELTYSFSSRNEGIFSGGLLDAYHRLSTAFKAGLDMLGVQTTMKTERALRRALTRSPLCFRSTSYGEISHQGKKLIGSAQKRWQDGFLQQGSIPYSIDFERLNSVFNDSNKLQVTSNELKDKEDSSLSLDSSLVTRYSLLSLDMIGLADVALHFTPEDLKRCIRLAFERTFGVTLADSHPSPQEEELALLLSARKYQAPLWTEGGTGDSRSGSNNEKPRQA